jgi:hypothetical protein
MHRPSFTAVYWSTAILYKILTLLCLYEICGHLLPRLLPPLALLVLVAVGVLRALHHPMGYSFEARLTAAAAFWFDPAVLFLEALIFLFCVSLSLRKHHPITWSRYSFGILVGFGLASCSTFLTYMARFRFGARFEFYFHHLLPMIYFGAATIWLIAFLRPESPTEPWSPDYQRLQQHQNVADEGWNDAEQSKRRLRKWWRRFFRNAAIWPRPIHSNSLR